MQKWVITGMEDFMALMDKFLNYMKLNDDELDDEYYDDEDDYLDDEEEEYMEKPTPRKTFSRPVASTEEPTSIPPQLSKVTPMRPQSTTSTRRSSSTGGMEVCVIKPVSIEDAKEITDTLRCGRAVVLNLEGLDIEIAQRIIDFASGSSYAIDGKLQKISNHIFILTPKTVDISGDFQDVMAGSKLEVAGLKTPLR